MYLNVFLFFLKMAPNMEITAKTIVYFQKGTHGLTLCLFEGVTF